MLAIGHLTRSLAVLAYLIERTRGWRVLALVAAPVVWFQAALLLSGVYAGYVSAQGGPPLEETPFFDEATARERLGAIVDAGAQGLAYAFYGLDLVNAVLLAAAFAALIAFGLRRLGRDRGPARLLLLAPAGLLVAEVGENLLMALALNGMAGLGAAAGIATGVKFVLFALSAVLALAGLAAGILALMLQRRVKA